MRRCSDQIGVWCYARLSRRQRKWTDLLLPDLLSTTMGERDLQFFKLLHEAMLQKLLNKYSETAGLFDRTVQECRAEEAGFIHDICCRSVKEQTPTGLFVCCLT